MVSCTIHQKKKKNDPIWELPFILDVLNKTEILLSGPLVAGFAYNWVVVIYYCKILGIFLGFDTLIIPGPLRCIMSVHAINYSSIIQYRIGIMSLGLLPSHSEEP